MMRIQSACLEQTIFFETQEPQSGGGWLVRLKKRYTHYPVGDYLA